MNLSALYDNPTSGHPDAKSNTQSPPPPNTNAPPPTLEQVAASRMYDQSEHTGKVGPQAQEEQKPVEKTAEQKLYGDTLYNEAVLIKEHPTATPEQLQEANASYRSELGKLELTPMDARQLTDTFNAAMRAPLDDAAYDKRAASFQSELMRRFGSEAEERLADVRKLLAKADPAVTEALVESGMNVDIETVARLANHARSLKGRGRL